MSNDLITPGEAAQRLGVCQQTIYRWILRGKLAAQKRADTRYLVRQADVEALLAPVRPQKRIKIESNKGRKLRDQRTAEILAKAGLS